VCRRRGGAEGDRGEGERREDAYAGNIIQGMERGMVNGGRDGERMEG
jgi:hypothetical protein